jgi:predicted cupin superfamily sugar epimerase
MVHTANNLSAVDVIRLLGLVPHPEGGHFCETFRDAVTDASGRAASTAIYFLLAAGEISRWHRVDAAEAWHWHAGAPLELTIADTAGRRAIRLGADLTAGERPQAVVPVRAWQKAVSLGAWTLVGCTVAPGFQFAGFELAPSGFEGHPGPSPCNAGRSYRFQDGQAHLTVDSRLLKTYALLCDETRLMLCVETRLSSSTKERPSDRASPGHAIRLPCPDHRTQFSWKPNYLNQCMDPSSMMASVGSGS